MTHPARLLDYLTPTEWLDHVFSSQSALRGGLLRRKVRDVARLVGRPLFRDALRKRGSRAVENGDDVVGFCNRKPIRIFE